MIDPEMVLVDPAHQSVGPAPSIGMDDTLIVDSATDHGLAGETTAIGNALCKDPACPLENPKDNVVCARASAVMTCDSLWPEVLSSISISPATENSYWSTPMIL